MSVIKDALQSKPELVVLQTTTVNDIAAETGTIDVLFIPNPKNCGYDYLWFENADNQVVKVKIGTKAAAVVNGKSTEETVRFLCGGNLPIYVNTSREDGTPLAKPVFTFGPKATLQTTAKFSFASMIGKQALEGKKA